MAQLREWKRGWFDREVVHCSRRYHVEDQFAATFEVKEYGLYILDPIRYKAEDGKPVKKVALKTGGGLFEVKSEVHDIKD